MRLDEHLSNLGNPVVLYPGLVKAFGRNEALFIQQLSYWKGRGSDKDWVYKTAAEWEDETTLTKKEQMRVRKKLRELGVVEERHDRMNHRMYYKLCTNELDLIYKSKMGFREVTNGNLPPEAGDQKSLPEVPSGNQAGDQKSLRKDTENTTENTTERTPLTPLQGVLKNLPPEFNCIEFVTAWQDWVEHRKEIRKKLTPRGIKMNANLFAKWGVNKTVAAIQKSLRCGYQGIFDPKEETPPDRSVPYPEIADSLNRHCGERIAPIQTPSNERRKLMQEFWEKIGKDMKQVDAYFARVAKSSKLMGYYGATPAKADWLIRWDNAARIIDGQFDNGRK